MQYKPMTRTQLAGILDISTRTLNRFFVKENIPVEPRAMLKPKLVAYIIQKYHGN